MPWVCGRPSRWQVHIHLVWAWSKKEPKGGIAFGIRSGRVWRIHRGNGNKICQDELATRLAHVQSKTTMFLARVQPCVWERLQTRVRHNMSNTQNNNEGWRDPVWASCVLVSLSGMVLKSRTLRDNEYERKKQLYFEPNKKSHWSVKTITSSIFFSHHLEPL